MGPPPKSEETDTCIFNPWPINCLHPPDTQFAGSLILTRGSLSFYSWYAWDRGLIKYIWQSLDRIANRDMKKKEKRKRNRTQTLTRGTTSNEQVEVGSSPTLRQNIRNDSKFFKSSPFSFV